MGSTLSVTHLQGLTSGNDANTIYLDSGHDLHAPGHMIQVVTETLNPTAHFSTTSGSYVTSANLPSATITPKFSNSKILIHYTHGMQHDNVGQIENTIYRIISGGTTTDLSGGNTYGLSFKGTTNQSWTETSINWVDSPNTTSPVTYTWYSRSESSNTIYASHSGCTWTAVLMEIAQ